MEKFPHKLGIGVIPTPEEGAQMYALVEKLQRQFPLRFAMVLGVSRPHLTLFQGKFPSEKSVIEIAEQFDPHSIGRTHRIDALDVWAERVVFLNIVRDPKMMHAHQEAFDRLFSRCEGRSADPQKFVDITEAQQHAFDTTGYPFSGEEAYVPHFTVAHIEDPLPPKAEIQRRLSDILTASPLGQKGSITFDTLMVYKVGEKGACTELIYEKKILF